jgi:homoprotocatechuate degradation regulator HpaR
MLRRSSEGKNVRPIVAKPAPKAAKRPKAIAGKRARRAPSGQVFGPKETDEAAPEERALPVSLLRAREAVMQHMRPILRAHGFTEQQWRVLRSLDQVKPLDKTTLAARSTLMMPSLLRILKDLEQMGLLRPVPSLSNPRLSRIALTAKGANVVEKGSRDLAVMSRIVRDQIGGGTVDELLKLLRMVESRLVALK